MSLNIIVYYNPANHIIYCESIDKKQTYESIVSFLDYLDKLNNKYPISGEDARDVHIIITDQGVEFQKKFEEYLDSYDIEHMTIPSNIDHLLLAGINRMCAVVRDFVLNRIDDITDQKQQLLETVPIKDILEQFMEYHNTEHKIYEYKKPPVDITEEEVQIRNQLIRQQNSDNPKTQLFDFKLGDIVQVRLKKDQFEKKRTTKWSKGLYKIINKFEYFYQLIPCNYDSELFKQAMKSREYQLPKHLSVPVYFRKGYELHTPDKDFKDQGYQPRELENTQFMTFDKIIEAIGSNGNKYFEIYDLVDFTENFAQVNRFYRIKYKPSAQGASGGDAQEQEWLINQKQLRYNKLRMNDAEKVFWFDVFKEPNMQYVYNFKAESGNEQQVPDGYELKLCKNGKYRLYKILTDAEKQARAQKMQEGRRRKQQELKASKQSEQQPVQQVKQDDTPKLTRDDVKGMMEEYFKLNRLEQSQSQQQSQVQSPVVQQSQSRIVPDNEQQSKQPEPIEQQPVKKHRHIQKVIKSRHALLPDEVQEVSVDDDYDEPQYYQW